MGRSKGKGVVMWEVRQEEIGEGNRKLGRSEVEAFRGMQKVA